jgi:Ca2+-binding RTX toxin-like protein
MKVWENRQAQQAARIGGLGLMAVSLAACGGSSTTTTTTTTTTTPVAPTNQAFTLTVGVDSVTGGAGNDTISGARVDDVVTLNAADSINGGAGTDTLTARTVDGLASSSISNVENLVFTETGAGGDTITFSTATSTYISGATSITNLASTNPLTFARVGSLADLTVNNVAVATTLQFADAVLSGASDTVTVNLIGATAAVTVGTVSDSDGDYETLVINASGAASDLVGGGGLGADATTVTINASVALDLGTTPAFGSASSVNMAGSTGGVTLVLADGGSASSAARTVTGGAGGDAIDVNALVEANVGVMTVSGGAGDDTITLGDYTETTMVITGGTGTDTLVLNETITAANSVGISGFEVLNTSEDHVMTNFTQNSGILSFTINDGDADITAVAAGAATLTLADDGNANGGTTSISRLIDGSADIISVIISAATVTTSLGVADEETITIDSGDGSLELTTGITATDATSIVVTGDNTVDLGAVTAGSLASINASALTGAAGLVVESSSSTVAMTLTVNAATSGYTGTMSVISGSGNDTLNGTANNDALTGGDGNDTISGNAGDDAINGGNGSDTLNGGAGVDSITGGAGADTMTGGAGADVFVIGVDGGDVITDFTTGSDDINLVAYTGNLVAGYAEVATVATGFTASNIIVIGGVTTIANAAAAIAADADVVATTGVIVISDGTNTYVYGSDNLAADGTETLLVTLNGITDPTSLVAGDFLV